MIFIVDDERVIASTLSQILRQVGYDAVDFGNLNDAVEAATTTKPDLLITDIILSSEDGLNLAEQIGEMHTNCKVIVMSGRIDAQVLMASRNLNYALLPKPCHPKDLIAEVERILE